MKNLMILDFPHF